MTDAGWAAVASIFASVSGALVAWSARKEAAATKHVAKSIAAKTDEQTGIIKEAAKSAADAAGHSNGQYSRLEARFDEFMKHHTEQADKREDKLIEKLAESAPQKGQP